MKVNILFAPILAGAIACSPGTPGTGAPDLRENGDLSLAITSTDVRRGGEVAFRFTNGGDDTVTTGVLDCVNYYERRDGDTWVPVHPLRMCIAMAQLHAPGETNSYQTPAPDAAGTWRLVIEATSASGGGNLVVRSAPFAVTE
jgi:hypothetical protein